MGRPRTVNNIGVVDMLENGTTNWWEPRKWYVEILGVDLFNEGGSQVV